MSLNNNLSFFGAIAMNMGLVTEEALNEAVNKQEKLFNDGERKRLGDILSEMKLITSTDIEIILAMQQAYDSATEETRFGELAISNGLITSEDMDKALELQKAEDRKESVGDILIEMKKITAYELNALLYTQKRLREKFAEAK